MIQYREKSGQTDDTEFIRPHYRGSKNKESDVTKYFTVQMLT